MKVKYFQIRITYGEGKDTRTDCFSFYSDSENRDEKFDAAVKHINRIYSQFGHFKTRDEVLSHFAAYGFTQIKI